MQQQKGCSTRRSLTMYSGFEFQDQQSQASGRNLFFELNQFVISEKEIKYNQNIQYRLKKRRIRQILSSKFKLVYNIICFFHQCQQQKQRIYNQSRKNPFIIYPDDKHNRFFDAILCLTYILNFIYLPYRIAFGNTNFIIWIILDIIFDLIFLLEIITKIRSSYLNRQNQIEDKPIKIILNYITGELIFDLFALVPINYILDFKYEFQKAPRLLKILKLPKVIENSLINQHVYNWEYLISALNKYQANWMKIINRCLFGQHLFACIWHLANIYLQENLDSDGSEYIRCIYWSLQTFSMIGYGNDPPQHLLKYFITIIWMSIGAVFYCFMLINLKDWLQKLNYEITYFRILKQFKIFFKEITILEIIQLKIFKLLKLNFRNNLLWSLNQQLWFQQLPNAIKIEIAFYIAYDKIKNIHFLTTNILFTSFILQNFLIINIKPKKTVWIQGEPVKEIYFLIKGKIQIQTKYGKELLEITEGKVFGEQEYFTDGKYNKSILRENFAVAMENSVVLIFQEEIFFQTILKFPQMHSYLSLIAKNREIILKYNNLIHQNLQLANYRREQQLHEIRIQNNISQQLQHYNFNNQEFLFYESQLERKEKILKQMNFNNKHKNSSLKPRLIKVIKMIINGIKKEKRSSKIYPQKNKIIDNIHNKTKKSQTLNNFNQISEKVFIQSPKIKIKSYQIQQFDFYGLFLTCQKVFNSNINITTSEKSNDQKEVKIDTTLNDKLNTIIQNLQIISQLKILKHQIKKEFKQQSLQLQNDFNQINPLIIYQ